MDYCLLHQMNTFGPKCFWFSCMGKKVPFWEFLKILKNCQNGTGMRQKLGMVKRPFRSRSKQCGFKEVKKNSKIECLQSCWNLCYTNSLMFPWCGNWVLTFLDYLIMKVHISNSIQSCTCQNIDECSDADRMPFSNPYANRIDVYS